MLQTPFGEAGRGDTYPLTNFEIRVKVWGEPADTYIAAPITTERDTMRILTTILTILAVKNIILTGVFFFEGHPGLAAWASAQAIALMLLVALAPQGRG